MNKQKRVIEFTIRMFVDYHDSMSDDSIDFHLNESSFCLTSLIDDLLRDLGVEPPEKLPCVCWRSRARVLPLGATLDIDR